MRGVLVAQVAFALVVAARTAAAQGDIYSKSTNLAHKAANAASAHVDAEQHPEAGQKAPAQAAPAPAATAQTAAAPKPTGKSVRLTVAKADTIPVPTMIYREAFDYSQDGRRDPFVSLLTTNELRPTLSDLRLSNIIYDPSGHRSIAVMRDLTNNAQYRVMTGSALGRMRVTDIHVLSVVFTIEEFGTSRLDSLVLRDTTKRVR